MRGRRPLPQDNNDPFEQDHDMEVAQRQINNTQRQSSRVRATSLTTRGVVAPGNVTRETHPQEIQDHDMEDPRQQAGNPIATQQPTRGRTNHLTNRGAGFGNPTQVSTDEDTQMLSAPQRGLGLRNDDPRQNHSVSSRRTLPDEYEETDRDEVLENVIPQPRGRSRAPSVHRPAVPPAQAVGPPEQMARGRPTGPSRSRGNNLSGLPNQHQDDRNLNRPPPMGQQIDDRSFSRHPPAQQRAPPHEQEDQRVPRSMPSHRGNPIIQQHRDEAKTTMTRSRSMEPAKGINEILVSQIVSTIREENAVLVSLLTYISERSNADTVSRMRDWSITKKGVIKYSS
jgi:hypothetical protein